tara:strand:- start:5651 stop:5926 length:276 start_codon:yes stop_codon:yes gene_type:complete
LTQQVKLPKQSELFHYRATPVPINKNWKEVVSSLRGARERLNLSQEALADKIGCADSLVGKWERYERLPSGFMFLDWIEAVGCEIKINDIM